MNIAINDVGILALFEGNLSGGRGGGGGGGGGSTTKHINFMGLVVGKKIPYTPLLINCYMHENSSHLSILLIMQVSHSNPWS